MNPAMAELPLSEILKVESKPSLPLTKVIATVGGNSRTVEELTDLLTAGMSIARFDFSFADAAYHTQTLENLKVAMQRTGKLCATMMDTKGPEVAIVRGSPETEHPPIMVEEGGLITITTDTSKPCSSEFLPVDFPSLPTLVKIGTSVFVGQYLFTGAETTSCYLTVQSITQDSVVCKANNSATLTGAILNVQIVGVIGENNCLPPTDIANIMGWCVPNQIDFISLSFCMSASDVLQCRKVLCDAGSRTQVIAKVERVQALKNFEEILVEADGIIFSRGCLGLDIPSEKMFLLQKNVIQKCNEAGKPVVLTRVVDTMTSAPRPTRAEATDVANAVLDGVDGIMLGAETLRGMYAKSATSTVLSICSEAEKVYNYESHYSKTIKSVGISSEAYELTEATEQEALASSAVRAARKVNAAMLVVFTETGATAKLLAKYKPETPIVSLVIPQLKTDGLSWSMDGVMSARQSLLYRAVFPQLCEPKSANGNNDSKEDLAIKAGKDRGIVKEGDCVVVCQRMGDTSIVKIVEVN